MRAIILTQEERETVEVGRVVVVDGNAYVDHSLSPLLDSMGLEVGPDAGDDYVREVARALHSPPYMWAELQEDDAPDRYPRWVAPPDIRPDRFVMQPEDIEIISG